MSGQQRTAQGEHHGHHGSEKHHHEHHQHLHNPTGYTDEVADEEREFMMQAERSAVCPQAPFRHFVVCPLGGSTAHANRPLPSQGVSESTGQNTKGQEGGLGSSNMGQQASSTMENVKNKAKDTLNMK